MATQIADVAVIGGTGFYSFLEAPEEHAVTTPDGCDCSTWADGLDLAYDIS